MKEWVWTHGQVVDAAWAETDSVLPMTFDCIIHPAAGHSADETVAAWLHAESDRFRSELAAFAGKAELGVQVLWQVEALSQALVESDPEVRLLQQELLGKPKGMAYFYQQKIQKALKHRLEVKADEDYRRHFRLITMGAADVNVNKVKRPAEGKQMLLNLSLLVGKEQVTELGERLDQIEDETGVEVRFTGPWPPYSFVAKTSAREAEPAQA